jgi:hypothetical protein
MLPEQNRQDKFGYYTAGNLKFFRKLEAIEYELKTGEEFHWNFNDEVYSCHDWTVEPTETLEELYRQRAQELRDRYDYLVLYYSGGADSNNILQTCLKYKIRIDEIVSYVNYSATGDKFNFMNGEIFNVAAVKHQEALVHQPWIKHRVIDLCQHIVDYFNQPDIKFDWIYDMRSIFNPNCAVHQDMKLTVPEWKQMFDIGKRVGFIYGCDKPRLVKENGKFYFYFVDLLDNSVSGRVQSLDRPWEFNELFYWDPACVKMIIKQAHVLKRFLNSVPLTDTAITTDPQYLIQIKVDDDVDHWLKMDAVHSLIYPFWTPTPYQIKASNLILTPRDQWFFEMRGNEVARYAWDISIKKLLKFIPSKYRSTTGLKVFNSKRYCIDK